MKLKLAVVTLWAEDVNRAADFYRDVLGLPLVMIDRGRPHFDLGGAYLVILPGKPHKLEDSTRARFPVLAFATHDLEAVVHHLKSQKVEMPWGVEEDSDSRWVMFTDPGGNLLEVARFGNKHQGHDNTSRILRQFPPDCRSTFCRSANPKCLTDR